MNINTKAVCLAVHHLSFRGIWQRMTRWKNKMVNLKLHGDVCDLCSVISDRDIQRSICLKSNKQWNVITFYFYSHPLIHFDMNAVVKLVLFIYLHHSLVCILIIFVLKYSLLPCGPILSFGTGESMLECALNRLGWQYLIFSNCWQTRLKPRTNKCICSHFWNS